MKLRIARSAVPVIFGSLILPILSASPAVAAGVVGTGSRRSCTEAALDAALAGGGSVTFNCGTKPFKIILTASKTIVADTSLDGGGLLTLSGGGKVPLFRVQGAPTLNLSNATFTKGNSRIPGVGEGVVQQPNGILTVSNSTFSYNRGGAIDSGAAVTITNSTFTHNSSGPVVSSAAMLDITGSTFVRNTDISVYNYGTLNVANSTFARNNGHSSGGAIQNSAGTATVTNSTFLRNHVTTQGGAGGAIANGTCCGSGSSPPAPVTLTVIDSTFSHNRAGPTYSLASQQGGGAIWSSSSGDVVVVNSTFDDNSTPSLEGGGAIANTSGADVPGPLTLMNCTFSSNRSRRGGAVYSDGPLLLQNTIVANNDYGGKNCAGTGPITDGGHNLRWPSSDTTCVGVFGDPMLSPLANNGGPTQTMAPQPGSAAIEAGDNAICAASPVNGLDQRGYVRPGAGVTNCSIGAYEFNAVPAP